MNSTTPVPSYATTLEFEHAKNVLECLYKLSGRTVHMATLEDGEPLVLHFNGSEHGEG